MARTRRAITVAAAAAAAFAMIVPAASAATTTIRAGGPAAPAYSGNVQAALIGVATVSSSLGSGSCNQSTMTGSIQSDGTGLNISAATFTNNGGPCTGAISATITAQNLPWVGGNVTYAPVAGGRDGTVVINSFRVRAALSIGITCTYGGNLTANGYNLDNPNRPAPAVAQAQVGVAGATVSKVSPSGFLCPATAQVTATYQLQGETTPGNFNQALYVTS